MSQSFVTPTPPSHPVRDAVRGGDYERAALRLLYGFLRALEETAPDVKDELLHLMVERRRSDLDQRLDSRVDSRPGRHPAGRGRMGGHR